MLRVRFALICTSLLGGWPLAVVRTNALLLAEEVEQTKQWEAKFEQDILPIVRDRCVECHSGDEPDGGFDVAQFSSGELVTKKLDTWIEVGKRLRLKEMPPEGSPQLNDDQKGKFHRWLDSQPKQDLCSQLATDQTQAWYRGFVMSRRLTRTEYLNAIRDSLKLGSSASRGT